MVKREKTIIKEEWVCDYIRERGAVDILNVEFVDQYIREFNPPHVSQPYGANTCKELNRLLSRMYKSGVLNRCAVGVSGGIGFPKWVYCYDLRFR